MNAFQFEGDCPPREKAKKLLYQLVEQIVRAKPGTLRVEIEILIDDIVDAIIQAAIEP